MTSPDAEQRDDEGVPARLRQQPLARIDQQDGEVGIRGARGHVAGILLVAGRVGDDEGAARRREIAVRDVDGDALLALGLEPVDEQREIDVIARPCRACGNRASSAESWSSKMAFCS